MQVSACVESELQYAVLGYFAASVEVSVYTQDSKNPTKLQTAWGFVMREELTRKLLYLGTLTFLRFARFGANRR